MTTLRILNLLLYDSIRTTDCKFANAGMPPCRTRGATRRQGINRQVPERPSLGLDGGAGRHPLHRDREGCLRVVPGGSGGGRAGAMLAFDHLLARRNAGRDADRAGEVAGLLEAVEPPDDGADILKIRLVAIVDGRAQGQSIPAREGEVAARGGNRLI